MEVKLNFLNVILVLFFLLGIIISAILLYSLPGSLLKETTVIAIEDVPALFPVLSRINIAVGSTLGLGFAAIVALLFSRKKIDAGKIQSKKNKSGHESNEKVGDSETVEIFDFDTKVYEEVFSNKKLTTEEVANQLLATLCKQIEASQGAVYFANKAGTKRVLELKASYAHVIADSEKIQYEYGEGLVGQAAKTGKKTHIKDVPEGYIQIFSGLGRSKPGELLILPLKDGKDIVAVGEIATFKPFSKADVRAAEQVFGLFGAHITSSKTPKAGGK